MKSIFNSASSLVLILSLLHFPVDGLAKDEEKGPARWDGDMVKFEKRDKETPLTEEALLFVGSSSIRMWDLESSWPGIAAINNGFGGSTLADSIYHFDRLFTPYQPSAIILYAGDNDISKGLTPEEVSADFEALDAKLKKAFPSVPVVFIAIKPSVKRWEMWPKMKQANDLIAALCGADERLHFADIAAPMLKDREGAPDASWFVEDGLHLSKFGYEQWTNLIGEILQDADVLP